MLKIYWFSSTRKITPTPKIQRFRCSVAFLPTQEYTSISSWKNAAMCLKI
jgi:hypothetical protein